MPLPGRIMVCVNQATIKQLWSMSGRAPAVICAYVFSDDIEWARDNLTLAGEVTYVEPFSLVHPNEDFRLMSACEHHVISNSSFSWWAAWLCTNDDKLVVSPKAWTRVYNANRGRPAMDTWIKL